MEWTKNQPATPSNNHQEYLHFETVIKKRIQGKSEVINRLT